MIIIGVLITGCGEPSLVPPDSEYPADIIGRVTIADTVLASNIKGNKTETTTISKDRVWWIVEVSVRNKEYTLPISALPNSSTKVSSNIVWVIIYNGKTWSGTIFKPTTEEIPLGKSGKLWLSFESKIDFNPTELQICYQGQEPFSYGKLVAGDTVAVYDWDSKKVTQTRTTQAQVSQKTIATVQNIWAGIAPSPFIMVELRPTSAAIANKTYIVDLYEKGKLRASKAVTFNQPQINVGDMVPVSFPATKAEGDAYWNHDINHIFSVKVHE
jgi:hypothetical protein